jgi:hypothetical protein
MIYRPSRDGIVGAQIIGTQKGGTTALFDFLSEHYQIGTPSGIKETHFFDNEALFESGPPDHGAYESLFESNANTIIRLEATPIYMYWRPVASRLAAYNPALKLIMILRDPVERAISQWQMEFSRGTEADTFQVAIERELEYVNRGEQRRVRSYIDRGYYGLQIRRLLTFFPREQMLFLRQEDLLSDHRGSLGRAYAFLGVEEPPHFPTQRIIRPIETRTVLPAIQADIREKLRLLFLPDLEEVEKMTEPSTK